MCVWWVPVPLESVSLCPRFSGFLTISSSGFNHLGSKLVGMFSIFFGILNVRTKGFCSLSLRRADARQNVRAPEITHICATKRHRAKSLATNIISISRNIPPDIEPKLRLKPKLDIAEKPENRVHRLKTDQDWQILTFPVSGFSVVGTRTGPGSDGKLKQLGSHSAAAWNLARSKCWKCPK